MISDLKCWTRTKDVPRAHITAFYHVLLLDFIILLSLLVTQSKNRCIVLLKQDNALFIIVNECWLKLKIRAR